MIKKIFIIFLFFYFFIIFENSFLPHFFIIGKFFSFTLFIVFLINLFGKSSLMRLWSSISAGIFLDIFSNNFFGFYFLITWIIYFFINFCRKRYLRFLPI